MKPEGYIAVDLGASSGRVVAGEWSGNRFVLNELRRFENEIVDVGGSLYWDILKIWAEIKAALLQYGAGNAQAPRSISVDAWGVDFALLDGAGRLISNPYSYRDGRTAGIPSRLYAKMPEIEIFRETGAYSMPINTLYQLYSMVLSSDAQLARAETMLMIPDLIRYWLCGDIGVEYTEATTTQMYSSTRRSWSFDMLAQLGISGRILPPIVESATVLSPVRASLTQEFGFPTSFPVVAGASHDTASAVAAIPGMDGESAFISSGTWSLMGTELQRPLLTDGVFTRGFTNEGGAEGRTLLVKNITGLWILQECLREWRGEGRNLSWSDITMLAEKAPPLRCLIDPDAPEFASKCDMPRTIQNYCLATGQPAPESPGEIARCILESLSLKYRSVLYALEDLTGRTLGTIRIVGGGSLNRFLCQMTADACGRVVVCGPVEASAFGSVMLQAVATGALANIAQGKEAIARSYECVSLSPVAHDAWQEAYARFQLCEARSPRGN